MTCSDHRTHHAAKTERHSAHRSGIQKQVAKNLGSLSCTSGRQRRRAAVARGSSKDGWGRRVLRYLVLLFGAVAGHCHGAGWHLGSHRTSGSIWRAVLRRRPFVRSQRPSRAGVCLAAVAVCIAWNNGGVGKKVDSIGSSLRPDGGLRHRFKCGIEDDKTRDHCRRLGIRVDRVSVKEFAGLCLWIGSVAPSGMPQSYGQQRW